MKRIATALAVIVTALLLALGTGSARAEGCDHMPVTLAQAYACEHPVREVTRTVTVTDVGFDWGSAAIGAGGVAALLLALGSSAAFLRRSQPDLHRERT